ncbi:MAG: U32 family peptidase, partial [Lachnospiraceae bacterium]|nr:U32 family peptidase [Candidatus Equihabitans merdae]
MKHPELLLPSGSMGVLKTAVRYGADACYIGGDAYSLRAGAINFSRPEMEEAVGYAHEHGVRIHVAANILAHNEDLRTAEDYFRFLNDIRPDAILVADPGMFRMAQRYAPDVEIHISTQANNTNTETCRFWQEMGAARVVMARELSLREIKEIRDAVGDSLEIEAFIHGAMCISYSGRCLLSNYLTGRDANHGACSHPCRWEYTLMEEKDPQGGAPEERPGHLLEYAIEEKTRPGVYMPVQETERGTYIFNSK